MNLADILRSEGGRDTFRIMRNCPYSHTDVLNKNLTCTNKSSDTRILPLEAPIYDTKKGNDLIIDCIDILLSIDKGEDIICTGYRICGLSVMKGLGLLGKERKEIEIDSIIKFTECSFEIPLAFEYVKFNKEISFEGCNFRESVDFSRCHLIDSNFTSTKFYGIANFTGCVLGRAKFVDTRFYSHVRFRKARFVSGADFTFAIFAEGPEVNEVEFGEQLYP